MCRPPSLRPVPLSRRLTLEVIRAVEAQMQAVAVAGGGTAGGGDTEAEAGQAAGCARHLEVALGAGTCGDGEGIR